jgi:hypothetical protein
MNNMKLNFLHICENAFVDKKERLSVINIFEGISSEGFPAVSSRFSIVTNISGELKKYEQKIEIISPKGKKIMEVRKGVETKGISNFIANLTNIVFPEAGEYKIKIYINEELFSDEFFLNLKKISNGE